MANPVIKIKRSAVAGKIPTTTSLELGELAINTYDGKLFLQQDQGGVGVGSTVLVVNPWSVGVGSTVYDIYFTAGDVGIGTTNPTSKLHVVGDVSATSFYGSGVNLSGIVTFITAGSGISVNQSTGQVTITATGATGAGSSQFVVTSVGIHTLSNIGIGTTNPTSKLTVSGDAKISGIVTVGTISYPPPTSLSSGTILAQRILGVHAVSLPAGDYGVIGAAAVDAFGISLNGFFDCLIEPVGVLAISDLGSL